jgi:hypothetical protein
MTVRTEMPESKMRLRKTAPIDREYAVYEVLDDHGNVVFDIGKSDDGVYEMSVFDSQGRGRILALDKVLGLVAEARRLIEEDV